MAVASAASVNAQTVEEETDEFGPQLINKLEVSSSFQVTTDCNMNSL